LLVVYDGLDYFRRARLVEVVDNLIAQDRIRPVALALLQNAGEGGRVVEYGCSEPTLAFVTRCVLPLARQQIRLLDHRENPGAHAILGASMGGLMAVFTAMSLPQIFGRALSQAGAFEIWEYETLPMRMARHFPRPAIKIWMSCGQMDFLLECNRKMHSVLREKDYEVSYVESGGAHNYTTWRDSLWRGLEELFTV
jgi:enterochelin esterase family protein